MVRVTEFNTSKNNNYLTLNGNRYSGQDLKNQTFVLWGDVMYGHKNHSLENQFGRWELCVEPDPVCSDGWKVSPVSVSECPHVTQELPDCELAKPGEMCEGDGKCGTRTDINNCYDLQYSYPASRDVYMKQHGSFNITEAIDWFFRKEEMKKPAAGVSTTAPREYGQGNELWQSQGPCVVDGACLGSPGFPAPYGENESCGAKLPLFSVVKVTEFKTQKFIDQLTINGHRYSGTGLQNHSFVVWSQIIWESQNHLGGQAGAWQLCVEPPPVCSDGLVLAPVSVWECPTVTQRLPNCIRAKPGELCEGDGKCGTRMDINNCYVADHYPASRDVYRKKNGDPVRWLVDGKLVDVQLRVDSLKCISVDTIAHGSLGLSHVRLSLTQPTYITVHSFEEVGGCCTDIEINNVSFNASTFFAKSQYFFLESARLPVAGQIDWVLCIGKPSPSLPPSPPSPYEASSPFQLYNEETVPDYNVENNFFDGTTLAIMFSALGAAACVVCVVCCKVCGAKENQEQSSGGQNQTSESISLDDLMRMAVILHAMEEAREAGERLRPPVQGIALRYVLEIFPDLVAARMENGENGLEKNFHELAPVMAVGPEGLGFGKICPRDGQANCSIVDSVHGENKGKAGNLEPCKTIKTHFLGSAKHTPI